MIATLAEVKSILGISDSTQDARIESLMLPIQNRILEYCKNDFAQDDYVYTSDTIYFTSSSKKIQDDSGLFVSDGLLLGSKNICVTHSLHNNKNYTVNGTITEVLIVVDETVVEEANTEGYSVTIRRVNYPEGLKEIFANMINTKIIVDDIAGGVVKSKKLESFSVTFNTENMYGGYLKSDWEALSKYRKLF